MILTTLTNRIDEQAKNESIRKVNQFAPSSYKAGFADGARWALKHLGHE